MCCFEVDINGKPIEGSIAIPDYVASMGCLIKMEDLSSDIWLNNFDSIKDKIKEILNNVFIMLRKPDHHIPINFNLFEDLVNGIKQISEWEELLGTVKNKVRIDSHKVVKPKPKLSKENLIEEIEQEIEVESTSLNLFNSFYFKDLKLISDTIKGNKPIGKALSEYLNLIPSIPRADIRAENKLVQTLLSPHNLAPARWPGNGDHPLVLSQQLAVNTFFNSKTEIFSVNGPPGTGKTTLLRDVIANIIVLRAKKLAAFNSPSDAFSGSENLYIEGYNYKVWKLNEELLGHSIVITGSNNTAVENITTEIPIKSAIDDQWEIDYFSEVASYIFGKECWGLTAAPLGSAKKVSDFFSKFWPNRIKGESINDFNTILNKSDAGAKDWQQAKKNFLNCLEKFSKIQEELKGLEECLKTKVILEEHLKTIEIKYKSLTRQLNAINETKQELIIKIDSAESSILVKEKVISAIEKTRPSFFARIWNFLFNRKKNSDWEKEYLQEIKSLVKSQKRKISLNTKLNNNEQELRSTNKSLEILSIEKQNSQEELKKINNIIFSFKEKMGNNFPDNEYCSLDDKILQKTTPWNFPELHELRAKIFIEALNLHKVFIINTKEKISNTLRAARQAIAQGNLPYDKVHLLPHIWEAFHLIIPAVSTTFASFSRLFRGMGSNTIGWLLIDEAGQALPQMAAGALFRAKRAMIVGDPLQIEPVRTIPKIMSIILRDHFKISDDWNPLNQSVQTLADRANPIGTNLQLEGNNYWIGAPLRVHRRCNDPMFSIANFIAYDNLMIYSSNNKPMPVDRKLSDSVWAHVTSNGKIKNNWSKDEGEVALNFLRHIKQLRDINCNLKSTFIISPYTGMKPGLQRVIKENFADKELFMNDAEFKKWMRLNVGTTHIFQGKETEIVIFILGGNPESIGGIRWASNTPNILNVALTRAKRAIYIIGDFNIWSKMNYFNQLAGSLPIKPYNEKLLPYKKGG